MFKYIITILLVQFPHLRITPVIINESIHRLNTSKYAYVGLRLKVRIKSYENIIYMVQVLMSSVKKVLETTECIGF